MDNAIKLVTNGYLNKIYWSGKSKFTTVNDIYYSIWVIDEYENETCLMLTCAQVKKFTNRMFANEDNLLCRDSKEPILEAFAQFNLGTLHYADVIKPRANSKTYYHTVKAIDSDDDTELCLMFTQFEFDICDKRTAKLPEIVPRKSFKGSLMD